MAHSVEVRVPFLDKEFLSVCILTEAKYKQPQPFGGRNVEKYVLRKAFDVEVNSISPLYSITISRRRATFPKRSSGARRSSSLTELATAGSTPS